ncbi:hypothetical protein DM790_18400 [Flavobacterium collinsii]|nr:hypothetical protein [Flavobacterium collinsii]
MKFLFNRQAPVKRKKPKKFEFIHSLNLKKYFTVLIVLFFSFSTTAQKTYKENEYLRKAKAIKYIDSKKAIYYYKKSIEKYKIEKDTFNLIHSISELADLYGHSVDYGNSYDLYWKALLLADQSKDDFSKATIYHALGWLYSFYQRDDEALKYFNLSHKLKEKLVAANEMDNGYIVSDYFALVNFYRVNGNYKMAKIYLDSCYISKQKTKNKANNGYIEAEAGFLAATDKKFDAAISKLLEAKNYFEKNDKSYLIIINSLLGNVYKMKGDYTQSEIYLEKSLALSKIYKSHANYKLMDHTALATVYSKSNKYKLAYFHANEAMTLNNKIFGRKSKNNQHLFEINDKYRIQKQKEKELLKEQHIKELESEENIWFLKSTIMIIVILFLIIYGHQLFKNIRRKHLAEKELLAKTQELELIKNSEILELKNKELTSSALQLIEKEEFIEKLKKSITENKENIDSTSINNMLKTIQGSSASNWKEFEARFTAVNQSFYKNLKEKYPDLGQTDLKICALVKLNFSSKDMSSLLGISFESVHTSRYRLRKKFKLDRNENLADFIASL